MTYILSRSINLGHHTDDEQENEEAIREAVTKDIGKPLVQTQALEIILVKNDVCFLETTRVFREKIEL